MLTSSRTIRRRRLWRRFVSALFGVAAAGVVFWLARGGAPQKAVGSAVSPESVEQTPPNVEVTRPHAGGILRTIQQPAVIHAFESVDLYAMISGYLKSQAVDIGSIVKKGEVLAEINIPRDTKDYEETVARVAQAKAQIKQADAKVKVAHAQREAAAAAEKVAESELVRLTARANTPRSNSPGLNHWSPSKPSMPSLSTSRRAISRRRLPPSGPGRRKS